MTEQFFGRKEGIFNKIDSIEKKSLYEILIKKREENNKYKNGEKYINSILDFHIKNPGNDNDDIIKLKKELNPVNFKQNILESLNSNINIRNSNLDNNFLCYAIENEINRNNYINNYLNNYNRNIILKKELNKIIEIESQINK